MPSSLVSTQNKLPGRKLQSNPSEAAADHKFAAAELLLGYGVGPNQPSEHTSLLAEACECVWSENNTHP